MTVRERTFGAASFPPTLPLPCAHHWDLGEVGRTVKGVCRHCGKVRKFANGALAQTLSVIRGNRAQRAKAAESEPEEWDGLDAGGVDYDGEALDGTTEV